MHLVVERVEQLLDERVAVLTVEVVWTRVPAAIVLDVGAFLKRAYEVEVRRSPEVLLPMRIVTLGPLVFLVDNRTEAGLVAVDHELFQAHLLLVSLQVLAEAALTHQVPHGATLLSREGQRVDLLLFFIEWLDSLLQVCRVKAV